MSFPAYPKYKDSGGEWIGAIPDHWLASPLKRAFKIEGGSTPTPDQVNWDGDIAWVTPADLSGLSSLFLDGSKRTITATGLASCGTTLLPAGSLILSTRAPIGSLAIGLISMCTNQGCKGLVPNANASAVYFAFVLITAKDELNNRGRGSTFLEISGDELSRFSVPTPPFAEQTQIARFLDYETTRIDALIEEQQRLIELLKEKRQAVISHAVTKGLDPMVPMKDSGVDWLGEVPAHWSVCQVRHLMTGDTRNGLYKPEGDKDPEGVGFVQMGEAFKDRIFQGGAKDRVHASSTELKNWGLEEGDLLFARRSIVLEGSGRCTRVGSLNEPHLFESSMIRVRLDLNRASPEYLHFMFDSVGMRAQVLSTTKTVTISGIDSGQLKGLRLAIPSKPEQENIAAYLLSRIEAFVEAERVAMDTTSLLQERRSALISAAVTGKIDVRDWQPPASAPSPELVQEAV